MRADALVRAMERLDPLRSAPEPAPPTSTGDTPPSLESYATGPWRWLGLGIRQRVLSVPSDDDIRVFLLRAEPGTRLLHHRHRGIEWTCVLEGAYSHDGGRFGPGDFEEADETVDHKLVVGPDAPCLCLVALERRLLLQGWLGRVLQPLIRI
jgi:putative transcriptional regulator